MEVMIQEAWKKALAKDTNAEIIDVRSEEEYKEGHIPGAKCIDVENPPKFMKQIEKLDKKKHYYIYCNSGRRGQQACQVLDYNGFNGTFNLEGGIQAWEGEKEQS